MVYFTTGWRYSFVFDPWLHDLLLLDLSFSSMHSTSLWRTGTIVFAKLNTPPSQICSPPSNVFEKISPPGGGGGLMEDLEQAL